MQRIELATVLLLGLASFAVCYDYATVLQNSLLFYEAQRSGKLPSDQKVTWRKDSALNDKGDNGEDLTGGYYDAGDFVKFGFQMAFTATVLSWGLLDHEAGYSNAGALEDGRKALKWATDYFIKAHTSEFEFYGQVGDGIADHNYWGRPEDMTMDRPAFKITESAPGSDLAAETAAALAAASLVFKTVDSSYSATLLQHAIQLFNFANTYRGKFSDSIVNVRCCYNSSNYNDELVWGAAWLYRATEDNQYLNVIEQEYPTVQYWIGFDWDQKTSGADVLLAQLTGDSSYSTKTKNYCDNIINNQQRTPKGLIFISEWGSLRESANAMFICLKAAELGISTDSYRTEAKTQIDYMLGDSGRSYIVGYGTNPPTHPHHRSSSCPDAPATCDWTQYSTTDPNPHVLFGALVGGPGANDDYEDVRSDYQHNEVACDYNAAFQGILAMFVELGYSS
uniref:Endoglucanase n=1 Tax=Timema cristinae TaxID=61476 RepID=A0A125SL14_TIMCR|nr:glycoside hydrolase family 9 [Timema cristinae]